MPQGALTISDLRPYRGYIVVGWDSGPLKQMLTQTRGAINSLLAERKGVEIAHVSEIENDAAFIHYTVSSTPNWTTSDALINVMHEILVLVGFKRTIAIHASESSAKQSIQRALSQCEDGPLSFLSRIPAERIEAALVAGRQTPTLWLSGIHRRTTSKADTKVLSGLDLRYALDPLADQSFCYTAARSRGAIGSSSDTLGVAPRKSAVWLGPARTWTEHRDTARQVLKLLADDPPRSIEALPVLAQIAPLATTLGALGEPYDAGFIPPELLDGNVASEDRNELENASRLVVAAHRDGEKALTLTVALPGMPSAKLRYRLVLELADPRRIRWTIEDPDDIPESMAESHALVRQLLGHRQTWLKIWFDSGYTLTDSALYKTRHRDLPFPGWTWGAFDGIDITKEKPKPLKADRIGTDDSLFCWVARQGAFPWGPSRGWLASNDGSMEIADFIHVDPESMALSLIHVKGSGSGSLRRQVSVSSYEVVVGQAVKNLRHLDHELLDGRFLESLDKRLKAAVWRDGRFVGETGRNPMKKAISSLGSNFNRRVVIVQPHVRRSKMEKARSSKAARTRLAAQQLDTLLLAARQACQSSGAELLVVGEDS